MANVGVTSWGQKTNRNSNNNSKDELQRFEFMKLKAGNNILRIITDPFRYEFARINGPKANGRFGNRINVAEPSVCPAKAAGLYIGERYYTGVLDLADKNDPKVKILDMSTLIYDGLTAILESLKEEHGKDHAPSDFNVNVRYDKGSKNPGQTYTVIQRTLEPLTDDQQAVVDAAMENLVKALNVKSGYYKPETVKKKMDEIGWTPEYQAELDAKDAKDSKSKKSDEGLKPSEDEDYSFDRPESASAAN